MRNGENFSAEDLNNAQAQIGYCFQDENLLKACFTHKSYSNVFGGEDNERLEFLGDAVLQFCVTEELYKNSPSSEGALTALRQQYVSQTALEKACERAQIRQFLRYSGGEHNVGGKTASNLFEAVVGAIYLDGGIQPVREFLQKYLQFTVIKNYKTLLQEWVQDKIKQTPVYEVTEENGRYLCVVYAMNEQERGEGESKKAAQMQAAQRLYQKLLRGN